MAIDTKEKRASSLLELAGSVFPDGDISRADRITLVGLYGGIIASLGLKTVKVFMDLYVKVGKSFDKNISRGEPISCFSNRNKSITLELEGVDAV